MSTHLHRSELIEKALKRRNDLHVDNCQESEQTDPHVEQVVQDDSLYMFGLHLFVKLLYFFDKSLQVLVVVFDWCSNFVAESVSF